MSLEDFEKRFPSLRDKFKEKYSDKGVADYLANEKESAPSVKSKGTEADLKTTDKKEFTGVALL